ncbi:MAG: hypothetical protein PHC35_01645 [Deltaproteobacteria bacterium]|nr:hypothetical protein [Deltaproteobacteria bacterium]
MTNIGIPLVATMTRLVSDIGMPLGYGLRLSTAMLLAARPDIISDIGMPLPNIWRLSSDIGMPTAAGWVLVSDIGMPLVHVLRIRNACILSDRVVVGSSLWSPLPHVLRTSMSARIWSRLRLPLLIADTDIGVHNMSMRNALVADVHVLDVCNSLNQAVYDSLRLPLLIADTDIGVHNMSMRNALVADVHVLDVCNSLNQAVYDSLRLPLLIADTDIGVHNMSMRNALVADVHVLDVCNSLNQAVLSRLRLIGNIDYLTQSMLRLQSSILDSIYGSMRMVSAIDATGITVEQDVVWLLDGIDITDQVVKADINLYGGQILSDARVLLRSDTPIYGTIMSCRLAGRSYRWLIEDITHDIAAYQVDIWGRALTAGLYTPYRMSQSITIQNMLARDVCQEYAMPHTISWQLPDYLITGLQASSTPLELIDDIAGAVGGDVVCMPDGYVRAVYPISDITSVPAMSIPLHQMLSCKLTRKPVQYDAVKVNYGALQPVIRIDADKTELAIGEWAEVRVYCLEPYTMQSTADAMHRVATAVQQVVTEEVELVDGSGSLRYPVLSVQRISGCPGASVLGQTVYGKGCKIAVVEYVTRYDLWRVTSYTARKDLVCGVTTDSSVMVSSGAGDRVLEVSAPIAWAANTSNQTVSAGLTSTAGLAMMRARKEYWFVQHNRVMDVELPHEDSLCAKPYIWVDTPYGAGLVTHVSISQTAQPLKIIDKITIILGS